MSKPVTKKPTKKAATSRQTKRKDELSAEELDKASGGILIGLSQPSQVSSPLQGVVTADGIEVSQTAVRLKKLPL